jgi:hypothetical protein
MKKTLIIIATLVLLILAGAGIFIINFNIEEEVIESTILQHNSPSTNQPAIVIWEKAPPGEQQLLPTNAVIPTVTFENSNDEGNMTFKQSHMEEQRERWEEKMNDPEFKQKIEQRQYQLRSSKYQPLITYLNMSDESKNAFLNIIIDRDISLRNLGIKIYGNLSHGITENNKEQLNFLREAYLSNMKKLLGEKSYGVYVQYELTEPERKKVEDLKHELQNTKTVALTAEQEDALVTTMYNTRLDTDVYVFTNIGEWPNDNYLSGDNKTKQLQGMDQLTENYIETASEILTPEQSIQFERTIKQINEHNQKAINFISNRPAK